MKNALVTIYKSDPLNPYPYKSKPVTRRMGTGSKKIPGGYPCRSLLKIDSSPRRLEIAVRSIYLGAVGPEGAVLNTAIGQTYASAIS
jgi:hypothetical protein